VPSVDPAGDGAIRKELLQTATTHIETRLYERAVEEQAGARFDPAANG
jgi:hypothetical protein